MVDSIGRMPIGKLPTTGKRRKDIIKKVKSKMQTWRDKARINIFEQRRRYKLKVSLNEALMKNRKEGREENLNPSAFSTMPERKDRFSLVYSTVSSKPKYSTVEPRKRIYGRRFEVVEQERRKLKKEMTKKTRKK